MAKKSTPFGSTPREHRISILPSAIGSIVVLAIAVIIEIALGPQAESKTGLLVLIAVVGVLYLGILLLVVSWSADYKPAYGWINAVATGLGLGFLTYAIAPQRDLLVGILLMLGVITSAVLADRGPSYLLVFLGSLGAIGIRHSFWASIQDWTIHLSFSIAAIIALETLMQLKRLARDNIRRLETITEFSRNISCTLDTKQVMALLSVAFTNAVEADTYFVGIREDNELRLDLVYDDGEYFDNQRVKLEGSLSSWVLQNQRSLFLPDLRKEVVLPGVRVVLLGQHKTSLSWLGVPMKGESVDGIISIGSYRPNAFDQADLELLTALAQHAAQALDNTLRHAQVELRSHLDSLTGVYNHGSFLKLLQEHADRATETAPLSLIMLDVDHFKEYNDAYGHLFGDEVLTALCQTIRAHIKMTDAVGRWGGEEFVIFLPNANASQAHQVASRIRDTVMTLTLRDHAGISISVPTVSQGIAVFPQEAANLVELIHLADQRLYEAKRRGRNHIEPDPVSQFTTASNAATSNPA